MLLTKDYYRLKEGIYTKLTDPYEIELWRKPRPTPPMAPQSTESIKDAQRRLLEEHKKTYSHDEWKKYGKLHYPETHLDFLRAYAIKSKETFQPQPIAISYFPKIYYSIQKEYQKSLNQYKKALEFYEQHTAMAIPSFDLIKTRTINQFSTFKASSRIHTLQNLNRLIQDASSHSSLREALINTYHQIALSTGGSPTLFTPGSTLGLAILIHLQKTFYVSPTFNTSAHLVLVKTKEKQADIMEQILNNELKTRKKTASIVTPEVKTAAPAQTCASSTTTPIQTLDIEKTTSKLG